MPEGLTTDLLSDFAQNNIDWLHRTTDSHTSLSSEEWSQLAIVCELLACLAKKYSGQIHTDLDRGIEAATLKVRLERSMAFLSDSIQAMTELQQRGERVSPNVGSVLDRIRNANAEARAVYEDLESLVALAEAEPPPVPEDILAAAEAGGFIRLDEFRKRQ